MVRGAEGVTKAGVEICECVLGVWGWNGLLMKGTDLKR